MSAQLPSEYLATAGFAIYGPNELVDTAKLLEACQSPTHTIPRRKSFLTSLYVNSRVEDAVRALLVEQIIAPYLGATTHTGSIELFYSHPSNSSPRVGQLYHLDNDGPQVKMFFYCQPVAEEQGPLTMLPAAESVAICQRVGYQSGQRLQDDEISLHAPTQLLGDAGTLALIDTGRCLHFGSRVRSGSRLVLVVQYVL